MSNLLAKDIQTLTLPNGDTRYILPRRQLGLLRCAGLVPVIFGTFFAGFAIFWMVGVSGLLMGQKPHPFQLIFMLWGIPFVLAGLFVIRTGLLLLLSNNAEVIVAPNLLTIINHAPPFRQVWRLPRDKIAGIRVGYPRVINRRNQGMPTITLIFDKVAGGETSTITGYPETILAQLANTLSANTEVTSLLRAGAQHEQKIPVTIEPPQPLLNRMLNRFQDSTDRLDQPPGSTIELIHTPAGITASIPPTGFRKAARFSLIFGLIWTTFSSIISVVMIHQAGRPDHPGMLGAIFFASLFETIGIVVLVVSVQLAFRKAVIIATPTELVFAQTGPFRKFELTWTRDQIKSILVADSGTEINDVPLKQIQVQQSDGKSKGILTGRDEQELRWLATELRTAIALHS